MMNGHATPITYRYLTTQKKTYNVGTIQQISLKLEFEFFEVTISCGINLKKTFFTIIHNCPNLNLSKVCSFNSAWRRKTIRS